MKNLIALIILAIACMGVLFMCSGYGNPPGETSAWPSTNAHPLEVAAWIARLN